MQQRALSAYTNEAYEYVCKLPQELSTAGHNVHDTVQKMRVIKNKGDKNNPSNYRPISLLSCVSKLLDRIVYDRLYDHISPLLHPAQSGFRRKDNTSLQLSSIIQDLCSLKDQRQVSCICFFDLSKAFDTVWHKGLIAKLRAHGVSGSLLAWITRYLLDRNQCVTVNGTLSDPESVTS